MRKRRQREKRGSGWVHWVHRSLRKKHRRNRNFRVLWVDVEKSWTQSMQRASACLQDLAARARQSTDAVDALRFSLNTPPMHIPPPPPMNMYERYPGPRHPKWAVRFVAAALLIGLLWHLLESC